MRIAIAGGHSKAAPGASGYLDEYQCDRAYVAQLIPALEAAGHEVVDCSNEAPTANAELNTEVRLANAARADIAVFVHLNAKGQHPGQDDDATIGTECYYTSGNEEGRALAEALSANVAAALGVRDRGAKTATYYVLRNTTMTAVLLEVCFVDDKDDAACWHRTPWLALTDAVVGAVGGVKAAPAPALPAPAPVVADRSEYSQWVADLQAECNAQGFSEQKVDGYKGPKTLAGCPTCKRGAKGNITRLMQQRLISLGYGCGDKGADGDFGSKTEAAVRAFQSDRGLTVDGVVGQNTWKALLGL